MVRLRLPPLLRDDEDELGTRCWVMLTAGVELLYRDEFEDEELTTDCRIALAGVTVTPMRRSELFRLEELEEAEDEPAGRMEAPPPVLGVAASCAAI